MIQTSRFHTVLCVFQDLFDDPKVCSGYLQSDCHWMPSQALPDQQLVENDILTQHPPRCLGCPCHCSAYFRLGTEGNWTLYRALLLDFLGNSTKFARKSPIDTYTYIYIYVNIHIYIVKYILFCDNICRC